MKKLNLLTRLLLAIALGIVLGKVADATSIKLLATFNSLFGDFLKFCVPLILLGFVTPGIANLERSAGKLLFTTAILAYTSTVLSGFLAYQINSFTFPFLLDTASTLAYFDNPEDALQSTFFKIDIQPVMGVMTALLLSFVLGLGIASADNKILKQWTNEFQSVVQHLISQFIIPLLPIHILGIFANMTFAGKVFPILLIFFKVFLMIILLHLLVILLQYLFTSAIVQKNPWVLIKTMLPAYFTAIGTQSSAATLPVTMACTEKNGVSRSIAGFTVPLCANIHMPGSTITLVSCAMAILMLSGMPLESTKMIEFILLLALTMIASPGVPGGSVMAALGLLQTVLGFNENLIALMIALYLAQDSFGTACNVTGDGAVSILVEKISKKL
jgi:Na+/H+-dicarboxylate symporter